MWIKRARNRGMHIKSRNSLFRERDMERPSTGGQVYVCPMHSDVRQPNPGKCPKCSMDLLPEGTRFALLRHMISRPLHLGIMAALMLTAMAAAMMLMR